MTNKRSFEDIAVFARVASLVSDYYLRGDLTEIIRHYRRGSDGVNRYQVRCQLKYGRLSTLKSKSYEEKAQSSSVLNRRGYVLKFVPSNM